MQQVSLQKEFSVPAERLYQAWTSPEELKQWWHPMGNQLTDVQNDLTPGGTVRYLFNTGIEGEQIEISGQYEKVEPAKQLVYGWNWHLPQQPVGNGTYKLTIGFEPAGGGSRLTVLQENLGSEEAVQPHQDGWEKALQDLGAFLNGNRS